MFRAYPFAIRVRSFSALLSVPTTSLVSIVRGLVGSRRGRRVERRTVVIRWRSHSDGDVVGPTRPRGHPSTRWAVTRRTTSGTARLGQMSDLTSK